MAYKKLGKLYFDLTPEGLSFQWGEEGAEKLINLGPLNRLAGDEIDRDHSDEDDYVYEDVYDSDSRYSSRDYDDDGYDYDARGGRDDRYDDGYDDRYDDGYDNGYDDDRYDEYDDGYDDRYDQPNDDDPYYQPGMDDEDDEGGYAPGILDTLFDLLDRFPWIVYVLLVLVPPLGIYLLWRQGMFDFTVRTVVSVVSGIWMLLFLIWIFSGLGGNPQDPTTNPTANINLSSVAPETIAPAATEDPLDDPTGEEIGDDEPAIELPGETIEPTPTALVSAGTLDGTGDDGSAFVFSPTSGAYYHKTGTCSAIGATAVTQVTVDIATSRGQIQCPTCFGSSVYFANAGGKYYHSSETCTNMTGAKPVTKSAAVKAGKTPCPECIREFYISSSNAYYHTKSNCSGMTNASQTTINAAKSAGKTACKVCVGTTTTKATAKATAKPKNYAKPSNKYDAGVIVYAKKGGVNYHRSATCTSSGMTGGQKITLYNAINFGYTACKYCLPDGNDTVYCDQNGKYYHKANSCSAAKNVVKTSLGKALAVGADKCSKCWTTSSGSSSSGTTVKQSGPKVYVTKSNNYYHTRKACGGMTNPTKIYLSEALAHNIKACNDCAGQANNAVYATSGDKTYHYSSTCSKLKGTPTKGTLAMALADELSACSKCVNTSGTSNSGNTSSNTQSTVVDKSGLSVYITQKGPYYHANTTCDGLGAEEFYKVSLGVATDSAEKDPCPKCCASASRKIYSSGSDTRYHYNKNCSLLPGTAKSATLARALMDGLKACPACTTDNNNGVSATPTPEIVPVDNSVSGKTVYVTQAGKTYHISKSCSKISKYEVKGISLETAKNYKMSACSTCSSIAGRTVYGSGSSQYYHASKKCNGLTYNNSGSLENALLIGLRPCPICISGTASENKATPKPAVKPTATPKPSSGGAADGTTTVYIDLANNSEIYHKSAKCSKIGDAVGVTLNYVLDIGFKGCGSCNPPTKVK